MRNCPKPAQQWTLVVGKQRRKQRDTPPIFEISSVTIHVPPTVQGTHGGSLQVEINENTTT